MMLRDNKPGIMHPGVWGLIGGHAEKGEDPIDTLIREVREETGLEIDKNICSVPVIIRESGFRDEIERSGFFIKGNWTDGDIVQGEGQAMRFIPYDKLFSLEIGPHVLTILDAIGLNLEKCS